MNRKTIVVIGMGGDGPKGLSREALERIETAKVLAGGRRHLAFFENGSQERIVIDSDIDGLIETLRTVSLKKEVVVLASGDPLFLGIGRALLKAFSPDELLFFPRPSSIALAFARVKQTWDDARVVSLHGRPLESLLPDLSARRSKIAVLTDSTNTPGAIADLIVKLGLAEEYEMWVCENLEAPDEQVSRLRIPDVKAKTFSPLNVVVLLRLDVETGSSTSSTVPIVGLPDESIQHASGPRGMITKREIRLISLAYLELRPFDVLWDVGAGSGSIAVEAARLSPGLSVFAVEKNPVSFEDILINSQRFEATGIRPILGEAPEAFNGLPDPNAIFIGGSGGRFREIALRALERLQPGGRIVANCVAIETFSLAWRIFHDHGLEAQATSAQFSRSAPLGRLHRFEPENPIFVLRATKP